MSLCLIFLIIGFILILDGVMGLLIRFGIPIPPNLSAPIGFVFVIISLFLNSIGRC